MESDFTSTSSRELLSTSPFRGGIDPVKIDSSTDFSSSSPPQSATRLLPPFDYPSSTPSLYYRLVYHLSELEQSGDDKSSLCSHLSRSSNRNSPARRHSRSPLPPGLVLGPSPSSAGNNNNNANYRPSPSLVGGNPSSSIVGHHQPFGGGGTRAGMMSSSFGQSSVGVMGMGGMGIGGAPSATQHPRREVELKQKIQALETTVAEYERQKFNVMGTFAEYRERVTERERKLEAEYSAKIISLSDEVLAAKKDFEERMKQFQALQEKFEREKEQALEKLRQEHQKEIQLLEQRCSESQLLNLEQKYMYEIQRLEEDRKSLKQEKDRLGDAFESKLRRAQNLYETELCASKALYSKELEALKDHEEALKEELMARQDEFRDRLEEIQHQFQYSKEELARCKAEVTELEMRLKQKEEEVIQISNDLEKAREITDESLEKLSRVENELEDTRQKYKEQEEELHRKSKMLSVLETARAKLESVIADLQVEVRSLRNKVTFLENERQNLESQSESQAQLQNSQVQALEAVMENLTKEKETTKDHFEDLLEQERLAAEEREFLLKKEYNHKIQDLELKHHRLQEKLEGQVMDEKEQLRDKVMREYEGRISDTRVENEALEEEVGRLRSKLHSLLNSDSTSPLKTEYETQEKELQSAKKQITALIQKSGTLTRELEEAKKEKAEASKCDLHSKHGDEIEGIKEELRKSLADDRMKETQEIRDQSDLQISRLKSELAVSCKEKSTLREQLETEQLNAKQRERDMHQRMDSLKKNIEELGSSEASEAESRLRDALAEMNGTVGQLNGRLEEAEQEIASLQQQLRSRTEEKEALESELRLVRLELDKRLEEQNDKVQALLSQISQRETELKDKSYFDELKQELLAANVSTNEIIQLNSQIENLKRERENQGIEAANDISLLKSQIDEKDAQIQDLERSVKRQHKELLKQRQEFAADQSGNSKLEEKQKEASKEDQQQDQPSAAASDVVGSVAGNADALKVLSTAEDTPSQKSSGTNDRKMLEGDEQQQQELIIARLHAKQTELESELRRKTDLLASDSQISDLESQLHAKDEEIKRLQRELSEEKSKLSAESNTAASCSVDRKSQDRHSAHTHPHPPHHQHGSGEGGSSSSASSSESSVVSCPPGDGCKRNHHSDSKRSSISSQGGGGHTPRESSTHLCKKAMNLAIVDKWHSLVNTLTHDSLTNAGKHAQSPPVNPVQKGRSGGKINILLIDCSEVKVMEKRFLRVYDPAPFKARVLPKIPRIYHIPAHVKDELLLQQHQQQQQQQNGQLEEGKVQKRIRRLSVPTVPSTNINNTPTTTTTQQQRQSTSLSNSPQRRRYQQRRLTKESRVRYCQRTLELQDQEHQDNAEHPRQKQHRKASMSQSWNERQQEENDGNPRFSSVSTVSDCCQHHRYGYDYRNHYLISPRHRRKPSRLFSLKPKSMKEKSPTPVRLGGSDAGSDRSGARSMSRVASPAVSQDGSLNVPESSGGSVGGASRRSADGKSPTRPSAATSPTGSGGGGYYGSKKGPIPIDKRPAWKF